MREQIKSVDWKQCQYARRVQKIVRQGTKDFVHDSLRQVFNLGYSGEPSILTSELDYGVPCSLRIQTQSKRVRGNDASTAACVCCATASVMPI